MSILSNEDDTLCPTNKCMVDFVCLTSCELSGRGRFGKKPKKLLYHREFCVCVCLNTQTYAHSDTNESHTYVAGCDPLCAPHSGGLIKQPKKLFHIHSIQAKGNKLI